MSNAWTDQALSLGAVAALAAHPDEFDGTTWTNRGTTPDGTVSGAAISADSGGPGGEAPGHVDGDGVDDYVDLPHHEDWDLTGDQWLAVWVRTTTGFGSSDNWGHAIAKEQNTFMLRRNSSTSDEMQYNVRGGTGGSVALTFTHTHEVWTLYVCTYDTTTEEMRVWRAELSDPGNDSVSLVGTTGRSGTVGTNDVNAAALGRWNSSTDWHLDAEIAAIAVGAGVLSESDAQALYDATFDDEGATVSVPLADTETDALTPAIRTGAQLSAPVADTEADALLPAVQTGASVSVPVADTEAAAFAPSVETGVRVTVPAADTEAEALTPSVETGASITVPVADTTAEALTPTVDTTEGATVAVPVAETTADAPLPTVQAGARVSVPVADTEAEALAPAVGIGTVVAVPVADTEADALAPEVRTGTTLQVPLADTVSDAMAPEVRTGVMVSVGVAETDAEALVPGLTVGIEPVLLRLPYTAHWIDPAREAQWKTPGGGVVATDQELALSDGSTLILSDGSVLVLGQTERVSPAREATWKDPARTAEWSTT